MFEKLEKFLDGLRELPVPGNDCIVCRKGEVVFRHTAGFADKEKTRPLTGSEKYQLFSCSKMITCCAALQLWEQGKFDLEDELCRYLPEYAQMKVRTPDGITDARNKITLRHLFTMKAGFNYDLNAPALRRAFDDTKGSCPTREVIRYLAQEPLDFEPGTKWQYSLAHDVLAAVVEEIAGMEFNEYVTKNIFDVLGMESCTFLLPSAQYDTLLPLYHELSAGDPLCLLQGIGYSGSAPFRLGPCYASGGAGCVSTAEDYNKLLQALCMGERILKRSTIDMMRHDELDDEQQKATWNGPYYSYGLGVRCPRRGQTMRNDFGWGGAGGAYFCIDPEREVTVLYMQHVHGTSAAPKRTRVIEFVNEIFS
ncbi:MAG: beta-lactamase family protein [Lentisphaeria bacterium]|nr:beta-lactamase family protein [Lentisphaeria bacterium]